ncbi:ribosomal protection-like ABC-F family protein [Bacillus velezensis]|uniref:ribosomal protection-like ABC-F family protein n=1 Tax=Bacillus velezensis TaxID=492670 RepID=UPI0035BF55B5
MKEMLKISGISYEINSVPLFEQISASVQQGDIIGVIGKNGAGKSLLLQLICNQKTPSQGQIQMMQDVNIYMVEQETEAYDSGHPEPAEAALLEKWNVPARAFSQLSGGEKLKARLAKGFSSSSSLLLLDEPTNHLDQHSLEILLNQIKNYKGTIIFVSHDRAFIDAAATKIWAIEGKKLIEHKGNYSSYMEVRKQRRLTQQREYENQQHMIRRIEAQMNELSAWSKKAHAQSTKIEGFKEYHRVKAKRTDAQIKSKQKRLEKELEKAKAEPVEAEYEVRFSIEHRKKAGKRFLEVRDAAKLYDRRTLFKNVNFTVMHGEKIAITGPNGSGKTTLLKVILGQEKAQGGSIWISPSANVGYLTQEVFDLPLDKTPEQLFYKETFEARGNIQSLMKHLGFTAAQWTEPIGKMSMGERVKCKLMAFILEEKDVLILDEPTNHLDLPSREQLEDTLARYDGTLIIVSHDRYFVEKTTDIRLDISNGSVRKQWKESPSVRDDAEELRLKLETERQEVLGKLSFMTPADKQYRELDQKFKELTKEIKKLK